MRINNKAVMVTQNSWEELFNQFKNPYIFEKGKLSQRNKTHPAYLISDALK